MGRAQCQLALETDLDPFLQILAMLQILVSCVLLQDLRDHPSW